MNNDTPRTDRTPVVVFDLESTLSDTRQRRDVCPTINPSATWDDYFAACGDDDPMPGPVQLARILNQLGVVFDIVTWRPARHRATTREWLRRHRIQPRALRMRERGDGDNSTAFKVDYIKALESKGDVVALFLDDWPQTVAAVAAAGVPTLCVNPRYADAAPVEEVLYLSLSGR